MWGDRATAPFQDIWIGGFQDCVAEVASGYLSGASRANRMRSAMSVFEMAKLLGSTGGASGGSISRRMSHSRNSSAQGAAPPSGPIGKTARAALG